jgi:hypothetical protein
MKKRTIKLMAVVLAVSVTMFSLPGVLNAQPNHHRSDFIKWLEKPVTFIASLLNFVPVYNVDQTFEEPVAYEDGHFKVTGDLNRGRPSEGD